jgi:hypothetical protein
VAGAVILTENRDILKLDENFSRNLNKPDLVLNKSNPR